MQILKVSQVSPASCPSCSHTFSATHCDTNAYCSLSFAPPKTASKPAASSFLICYPLLSTTALSLLILPPIAKCLVFKRLIRPGFQALKSPLSPSLCLRFVNKCLFCPRLRRRLWRSSLSNWCPGALCLNQTLFVLTTASSRLSWNEPKRQFNFQPCQKEADQKPSQATIPPVRDPQEPCGSTR